MSTNRRRAATVEPNRQIKSVLTTRADLLYQPKPSPRTDLANCVSHILRLSRKTYSPQDPEAKKPADWDERATIPDPTDEKPADWEKPEHIPDPDAAKPDDWDDEMDGEWEPPMIDNPEFKGPWAAKEVRTFSRSIS